MKTKKRLALFCLPSVNPDRRDIILDFEPTKDGEFVRVTQWVEIEFEHLEQVSSRDLIEALKNQRQKLSDKFHKEDAAIQIHLDKLNAGEDK